ncbi:protein of unknown function (plasmid) [Pararobbsia alpina]
MGCVTINLTLLALRPYQSVKDDGIFGRKRWWSAVRPRKIYIFLEFQRLHRYSTVQLHRTQKRENAFIARAKHLTFES